MKNSDLGSTHWTVAAVGIVLALLRFPAAQADGVCEKGARELTPAERDTMTTVLQTAKRALPPAPEGWAIEGDDQVSVVTSYCRDLDPYPLTYSFGRTYQRVDDFATRQELMREAGTKLQADQDAKQAQIDAVQARISAVSQQQVALIEKGEMDKAMALNEQLAILQGEYEKLITPSAETSAQSDRLMEQATRDQSMYVSVSVNPRGDSLGDGATRIAPPAGAQSAYRWTAKHDIVEQQNVLVLIGPWKSKGEGGLESVLRLNEPLVKPQVVDVKVRADPERVPSVMKSIDFAALAALVH